MEDYTSNSDISKKPADPPPDKKLKKVVTGEVVKKPQGIGAKFKSVFLGGDMVTAKEYLIADVLLPALRDMVVNTVSKGIDRLVYGDNSIRRRGPANYGSRVQYNNPIYRDPRTRASLPGQNPTERWREGNKGFEDVVVVSKQDADAVVDQMTTIVDQYEIVSVADLHELLGLPSSHVDNKWGWTHLANIEVRQTRDGYRISFPPLEEIS